MGGGNTSKFTYDTKVWPQSYTHENYSNNFSKRKKALVSYEKSEYLSLGQVDTNTFKQQFGEEIQLIPKLQNFYDAKRILYSKGLDKCCLLEDDYYYDELYKINSCDPSVHTFNSNLCDDILYATCLSSDHFKCQAWIRSVVEQHSKYFDQLLSFAQQENNRNHQITKIFLQSLIDFHTDNNNYLKILTDIINSYSNSIKLTEYKCVFPSTQIQELEKQLNVFKECWYKECALAEPYKLTAENIYKRKTCNITICDINIEKLNMTTNEVEIICQNTYNDKINFKNIALNADKSTYFFVPTYINSLIPILWLLSLLWIKI